MMPVLAYFRLKTRGKTYWDEVGKLKVEHKHVGGVAIVATITLTLLFFAVLLWCIMKDAAYQ
jgi:hypothetical protein